MNTIDFIIGIDDGETITGNVVEAKASVLGISAGGTYMHISEKGGDRISDSGNAYDGPFDLIKYDDATKVKYGSSGFVMNSENEVLISFSRSKHFIIGGHYSISFNLSEFFIRLCE